MARKNKKVVRRSKYKGRKPSNKSKHSKVKKMIRLFKSGKHKLKHKKQNKKKKRR